MSSRSEKLGSIVRVSCLYVLLFVCAFLLPTLLSGVNEVLSTPNYLMGLPQFLVSWPLFLFYYSTIIVKQILIPAYTLELQVSWLFVLLVLVELISPGVTLLIVERVFVMVRKWLSGPFVLTGVGNVSRKQFGLLGLLVLVLVGVWYQRVEDGLLLVAMSQGILALQMLGLFVILPLGMVIVIIRSSWFQCLESWLKE